MISKLLSLETTLACYPDDDVAEQIERDIASSLMPIASLTSGMTAEQRLEVFQAEAWKAREAFCAIHGDPFGADKMEVALSKAKGFFIFKKSSASSFAVAGA